MREASVQSENFLSLIEQAEFAKALKLETLTPVQSSYCLYRLNKLEEALDKLPKNPSPASSHLKAQIFYRMERYEDAAKLYATLLSGSHISLITSDVKETYQSELETNCNATMAAAFSSGSETTLCAFEKGSYELIFNRALVLAAQSRYEDALALFSGLEDICTNELKEIEADQGEIDKEVGKIRVQIGVVLQLMNEAEKAVEIYDSIVDSSPVVNAILANNRAVLNGPTRHIDSMLKLRIASASDSKLLGYQKRVVACNNAILLSNMKRYGASTSAAKAIDGDVSVLIQAGNSLRQNKGPAAYKKLKEYSEEEKGSMSVSLVLVQKHVENGEIVDAINVLEAYIGARGATAGVASLLIWLYHKIGDAEKALRALDGLKVFWDGLDASSVKSRKNLARYLIRMGRYSKAVEGLEGIVKADSSDIEAVALLVLAYSDVDPKKAETYARYLKSDERGGEEEFDVGILESGAELMSTSVRMTAAVKKVKRHRKGKMPKNPDAKLDLERWIPKQERSYNQKRKKKGGDVRGPQGVNMSGGGIGGTGSARINGETADIVDVPAVEKPAVAKVNPTAKKSKKGKKK